MGRYKIIYADPPWQYSDKGCNGNAEKHYSTMKLADIKSLPVASIADRDAVLMLWVTWPMLQEGLDLIKSWGFVYKSIGFLWVKKNRSSDGYFFGLGRWTRGNSEMCLLATKGKPKRFGNAVSQLVIEPLTRHSAKPGIVREKIVALLGDVPRIELFARNHVDGWDVFGNQVENSVRLPEEWESDPMLR